MNGTLIYVYIFKDLPTGVFLSVKDPPAAPEAGQISPPLSPQGREAGRQDPAQGRGLSLQEGFSLLVGSASSPVLVHQVCRMVPSKHGDGANRDGFLLAQLLLLPLCAIPEQTMLWGCEKGSEAALPS